MSAVSNASITAGGHWDGKPKAARDQRREETSMRRRGRVRCWCLEGVEGWGRRRACASAHRHSGGGDCRMARAWLVLWWLWGYVFV